MSRGQQAFRNRQRTGSNIWLKTTSFIIAKRILGIYTCPILTFTQRSIVVTLYNGSIGRKSIIITVDPVIVKQRDTLQRYVRSTVHAFRKDNRMNIIAIKETKFQRHFCLHLFRQSGGTHNKLELLGQYVKTRDLLFQLNITLEATTLATLQVMSSDPSRPSSVQSGRISHPGSQDALRSSLYRQQLRDQSLYQVCATKLALQLPRLYDLPYTTASFFRPKLAFEPGQAYPQ